MYVPNYLKYNFIRRIAQGRAVSPVAGRSFLPFFSLVIFLNVFDFYLNLSLFIHQSNSLTGTPLGTGRFRGITAEVALQKHFFVGLLKPGFDGT